MRRLDKHILHRASGLRVSQGHIIALSIIIVWWSPLLAQIQHFNKLIMPASEGHSKEEVDAVLGILGRVRACNASIGAFSSHQVEQDGSIVISVTNGRLTIPKDFWERVTKNPSSVGDGGYRAIAESFITKESKRPWWRRS